MSFDPMNQEIENAAEPEPTYWPETEEQTGKIFIYDLETVPDLRFEKPQERIFEERTLDMEAIMKTADTVKAQLADGVSKIEAEELLIHEQARTSPRKTVIAMLRKAVECNDQAMSDWHKLGTDPWSCRIVALGIFWYGCDIPVTRVCTNDDEEREALELFWLAHDKGKRAGYNIRGFDDRVIVARSMILGVNSTRLLNLNRYDKDSIDLMAVLFQNMGTAIKLKTLAHYLGIDPPAGDMDGSHVADLYFGGQFDLLREYVGSDCFVEMELLKKLQDVVQF